MSTIPALEKVVAAYPAVRGIHPIVGVFPEMPEDEFTSLVDSVRAEGLAVPILLTKDGDLLDGRHRLSACWLANVEPRWVRYSGADPAGYAFKLNAKRRHLTATQLAAALIEYSVLCDAEAVAKEAQKASGGDRRSVEVNSPQPVKDPSQEVAFIVEAEAQGRRVPQRGPQARDVAAASVGISGQTVQRAKKVNATAPDLFAKMKTGEMSVNDAYKQAQARERARPSVEQPKQGPEFIQLRRHTGEAVDYKKPLGKPTFNQTNDFVSWARWTWNPVTGCLHGCEYCYAREIANRDDMKAFYPVGFEPLFHHERLDAPRNTTIPKTNDARDGRVFVCSMADLFGSWVPQDWIDDVYQAMLAAPDWRYLTLTKFPQRYRRANVPPYLWAGASVDTQKRVRATEEAMRGLDVAVRWLSLEPLLEPLRFADLSVFDWIVIGSQSGTNQPSKGRVAGFAPDFAWVADIVAQAREAGCSVYLKPNLLGKTDDQNPGMRIPQEIPAERSARARERAAVEG